MIVIVHNKSRKRRLKTTKRILSSIIFPIAERIHIGDIPSRSIIDLIKKLKENSGSGVNINFFIASKEGYHGFKLVQIGKNEEKFKILELQSCKIDDMLIKEKIIKKHPNLK